MLKRRKGERQYVSEAKYYQGKAECLVEVRRREAHQGFAFVRDLKEEGKKRELVRESNEQDQCDDEGEKLPRLFFGAKGTRELDVEVLNDLLDGGLEATWNDAEISSDDQGEDDQEKGGGKGGDHAVGDGYRSQERDNPRRDRNGEHSENGLGLRLFMDKAALENRNHDELIDGKRENESSDHDLRSCS
ncbi:MAG: hypothetical protein QG668_345 [Patescibacteria group bacterium]|nr:hypothetical protein [Patescibacteria group bacterium]